MGHSTKPIWRGQFCRQLGFISSDQCCIRCAKKCNNFSRKCVNKVKLLTAVAKLSRQARTIADSGCGVPRIYGGFRPSSIYSCSIRHIWEHEFCHLGCWAVKEKFLKWRNFCLSKQLFEVIFSTFWGRKKI